MTVITDGGSAKLHKESLVRQYGVTGALTGQDIAYDGTKTLSEELDNKNRNIVAGANTTVQYNGKDVIINSAGELGTIPLPDYTILNNTPDRSIDLTSTTLEEVSQVLGTLINDIKTGLTIGTPMSGYKTVGNSNANYITDGTDDNIQIQQAIDDMSSAGGGEVHLKGQVFYTTTGLIMKPNVRLVGEKGITELRGFGAIGGGIIYQGAGYPATNCVIKDIIINSDNIFNVSGIQIHLFSDLNIEGITVKNVNGVWGILLGSYDNGVSYNLIMDGNNVNTVTNTSLEGFLMYNVENFKLTKNTFQSCDLNNASTISIYLGSKYGSISNNYFENSVDDFCLVDMTGAEDIEFTGNILKHKGTNGGNGVIIRNCKNINIVGNDLKSNNGSGCGVYLLDWSGTIDGHTNPYPVSDNIKINNNTIDGFYYSCFAYKDDVTKTNARNNLSFQGNTCTNYNFAGFNILNMTDNVYNNIISGNIFVPKTSGDNKGVYIVADSGARFKKGIISNNIVRSVSGNSDSIDLTYCDDVKLSGNMLTSNGSGVPIKQTNCTFINIDGCLTYTFTAQTSVNIVHNLFAIPQIIVLDSSTSAYAPITPLTTTHVSLNEFTITFASPTNGIVKVRI